MKIHQGANLTRDPIAPLEAATKQYVDNAATAALAFGLFVTDVTNAGIIADEVYVAGTVPTNVVVEEATSDTENVIIHILVEADASFYSPTVSIDVDGTPVQAVLVQDAADIRTFHGTATVQVADGLTAGRQINITASHGAATTVLIKRAPQPPEIQTMIMGTTFPAVSNDVTSSYPGGTQTTLKSGDIFTVTGTVDNSATLLTLDGNSGAVGAGTFTTATTGGALGATDSSGVGFKTFTIQFTAGSGTGALTATATPENSFSTEGSAFGSTDNVILDQVVPVINGFSVTYPASQSALKGVETADVDNNVTGQDYTYYSSANGFITIPADTTFAATKTVTRNSGDYLFNGNNFIVQAFKTSNGTQTTANTDVNIANVAPEVTLSGVHTSTRLISSIGGQAYSVTMTFDQQLLSAPTLTAASGSLGSVTGGGTTWSATITIVDGDTKGDHLFNVQNATNLANTLTAEPVINGGTDAYEIGGFTSRDVTVETFEQAVDLGVHITDPTKVTVSYKESSVLTYQGASLAQFIQGWTTIDGPPTLVYAGGGSPLDAQITYSNYVFQDATVTPSDFFFITDAAFAGGNTTGTLQITIVEAA